MRISLWPGSWPGGLSALTTAVPVWLPVFAGVAVLTGECTYLYTRPLVWHGASSLPSASIRISLPAGDDVPPAGLPLPAPARTADPGPGDGAPPAGPPSPEMPGMPLSSLPVAEPSPAHVAPVAKPSMTAAAFWRREGYMAYRSGWWQRAEQAYRQALRLMPHDAAVRHILVVMSSPAAGPDASPPADFLSGGEAGYTPAQRHLQQGNRHAREGDWQQAGHHYRRACRLSSNAALSSDCFFNRAVSMERQGKHRQALALYERVAGMEGDFPSVSRRRAAERARQLWRAMGHRLMDPRAAGAVAAWTDDSLAAGVPAPAYPSVLP